MSNLGFTVNVNDLPEDTGGDFDPIPAGDYNVRITEASLQTTKSRTGQYIKLRLDVVGPSHQGRVLFSNLNIKNDSQKAEEIGRQQLGSVMRAINLPAIQDTDQLVGGHMTVKVTVKNDPTYGASNEVKSYKAMQGNAAPMPMSTPAAPAPAGMNFGEDTPMGSAPAQAAPAAAAPPWAKR